MEPPDFPCFTALCRVHTERVTALAVGQVRPSGQPIPAGRGSLPNGGFCAQDVHLRGQASGGRRSPSPGCPSLGQAVGVSCPHAVGAGVRVWGPGTGPLACLPCWALRAAGVAGGCPGGGSSRRCEGRLGLGALPLPVARPWGRQPGPIARVSWARGARVWGPGTDPSVHALASWRRALRGWQEGILGGGASCLCEGRMGLTFCLPRGLGGVGLGWVKVFPSRLGPRSVLPYLCNSIGQSQGPPDC